MDHGRQQDCFGQRGNAHGLASGQGLPCAPVCNRGHKSGRLERKRGEGRCVSVIYRLKKGGHTAVTDDADKKDRFIKLGFVLQKEEKKESKKKEAE